MEVIDSSAKTQVSETGITPNGVIFQVVIPLKLTNRNDGQGHAWYRTSSDRQDIEALLIAEGLRRVPFDHPVSLRITRFLGKGERYWDADSGLRGNAKQLIDSLVSVGWFHDDSHRWIKEVRFFQNADFRKSEPSVRIEVIQEYLGDA